MRMHTVRFRYLLGLLIAAIFGASTYDASAQPYPSRPVRMIVPYAAGGATDIVARQLSARLNEVMAQPFVVENRAGAGGNIGAGNPVPSWITGLSI